MFQNGFWLFLYIALTVGVGGGFYYLGYQRGDDHGKAEAALTQDQIGYYDAGISRLAELGYEWDGEAWNQPASTSSAAAEAGVTPAVTPDRVTCAEINGTPYRSPDERSFFLSHCVTLDPIQVATMTAVPDCGEPANPWCYDLFPGELIVNPPGDFCGFLECVDNFWAGTGYVIRCQDGLFSKTGGLKSACPDNGGVLQPLYSH